MGILHASVSRIISEPFFIEQRSTEDDVGVKMEEVFPSSSSDEESVNKSLSMSSSSSCLSESARVGRSVGGVFFPRPSFWISLRMVVKRRFTGADSARLILIDGRKENLFKNFIKFTKPIF